MPNKHYKVGYTLERDVKKALEEQGYTVFRSAGSHSQADLIALDKTGYGDECIPGPEVRLVQCKRHRNLMTVREIKDFYEFASKIHCIATIAWRDKGVHMEDISL